MRRNVQADIAFIQNDLANEVIIQDDGSVVWPDGAMERLQAKLNSTGTTSNLREACARLDMEDHSKRVSDFKLATETMPDKDLWAVVRAGAGSEEQCRRLSYAKAEIGRRRGYPVG